jgi:sulfite exporter TauE/SafE
LKPARGGVALLLAAFIAIGAGQTSSPILSPIQPEGTAVVTGGIMPCSGLGIIGGPHYAAGTATVLKGLIAWKSVGHGTLQEMLPPNVVTSETVPVDGSFLFYLEPGAYVLVGHYASGSTVTPWVEINVAAGSSRQVDIPNMCI